jgi:palmitoyltransferase
MVYIEYLLLIRIKVVWDKRNLPSVRLFLIPCPSIDLVQYLGPSPFQLACLFFILVANSLICFVVSILLLRSLWALTMNVTTIESWEIERHRVLLRRARALGGYLDGPDGTRIRIVKQEFPYDVGIWTNINEGMRGNLFTWLFPFARSPGICDGLEFPVNEFEGTLIPVLRLQF